MARLSPEQKIRRITNTLRAWKAHAPRSEFAKHSLKEFTAAMRPALKAHARVLSLRQQLRHSILQREGSVKKALYLVELVGLSVKGDPEHGNDSGLCEALGYTRETVRRGRIRRGRNRGRGKAR